VEHHANNGRSNITSKRLAFASAILLLLRKRIKFRHPTLSAKRRRTGLAKYFCKFCWSSKIKYLFFKSDFLLTVTLIMKTVIGSAILGIPYTVSKCGFLFAIIVFLFALAATQFSVNLLLKAKNLSGHSNYSTILYHIINSKFAKALGSFLIFFDTIGTCNYIFIQVLLKLSSSKEPFVKTYLNLCLKAIRYSILFGWVNIWLQSS